MLQNRPLPGGGGGCTTSLRFQSKSPEFNFWNADSVCFYDAPACQRGRACAGTVGCAGGNEAALHLSLAPRQNATGLIGNQRGDAATLGAAEFEPNVSLLINSPLGVAGHRVLFCFVLIFFFFFSVSASSAVNKLLIQRRFAFIATLTAVGSL